MYEVDMTVEEGLRSIVTSGVTVGANDGKTEASEKVVQVDTTRTTR